MELYEALERLRFDSRMFDWNMQNGLLSEADLKKHLEQLPDLSNLATRVDWEADSQNGSYPTQ